MHLANIAAHWFFGGVVGEGYGSLGAKIGCLGAIGAGGRGKNSNGLTTGVGAGRGATGVALGTGLETGVGLGFGRGATGVGIRNELLGMR